MGTQSSSARKFDALPHSVHLYVSIYRSPSNSRRERPNTYCHPLVSPNAKTAWLHQPTVRRRGHLEDLHIYAIDRSARYKTPWLRDFGYILRLCNLASQHYTELARITEPDESGHQGSTVVTILNRSTSLLVQGMDTPKKHRGGGPM